jgi:hypothetical protein
MRREKGRAYTLKKALKQMESPSCGVGFSETLIFAYFIYYILKY